MSEGSEEYRSPESFSEKEKWSMMTGRQRAHYIWDYYKLPIVVLCIILYIIGYSVYRHFTDKDMLFYSALVNVNASEDFSKHLSDDFLTAHGGDPRKEEIVLYDNWYLTTDPESQYHEYAYATRMKVLASIDSEEIDVVLMNKEAFDAFAQNGYLYNIDEFLAQYDPKLHETLEPYFVDNIEIVSDNYNDVVLDPTVEYVAETTEYPMAIDMGASPFVVDAGFDSTMYLAVIGNTPRPEMCVEYIRYLLD